MKTTTLKMFSFLSIVTLILTACGGLGKMEKHIEELNAKAEPEPLIVRGDSVEINITGTFPAKYFHKKVVVEAIPAIVYEGGEAVYETQGYQGEDAAGNYEMIPYDSGKNFSYSDKVAFTSGMEESTLELRISGTKGSKTASFDPLALGTGVITTPYLVQSDDMFLISEDNFQRVLSFTKEATVNYAYNASGVRSAELRDQDIKDMVDFVKFASEKDSIVIKGTDVMAYASPEGEISLNENLAQERAESANALVSKEMKRRKMAPENEAEFFKNSPKGEDWDGFKTLMEASDIEDKSLIVRVLETYSDKTEREQQIKNISKTYKEIEKEILPSLRRSQITINYDVEGYTDEELSDLSKSNPDILTIEELLFAATLFEGLNDKLEIYQNAERVHPGDYRGANNVGHCLMMQNKMNDAKAKFQKALDIENNPYSTNNLGAIARLEGDRTAAMNMYKDAMSAGDAVKYNKGIVQIQTGDYASAINSMGSNNTMNLALAKVLNGDASGAKTVMDNSGDESAEAYYLRAVIGARMNTSADVVSNLTTAIEKDGTLKAKAMKDLEFRDFKDQINF
ncbi:MAG: tetratricopeptide (TPR) repeat protein [Flavobacteriales bacterium]|jgi:tetratricopeptide (TPR) repeat protein